MFQRLVNFRNSSSPEEDKPFLDHLEDLRITLTKLIITVLLSTVICWNYRSELMEIIQKPAQEVWDLQQSKLLKKLPHEGIKNSDWNDALLFLTQSFHLTPEEKIDLQNQFAKEKPEAFFHARTIALGQAAQLLAEPSRYLEGLNLEEKIYIQAKYLSSIPSGSDLYRPKSLVEMQALGPTEGFNMSFKLAFMAGIIVSFPLLLYFILQFILPGLKKHETKALYGALVVGFGLFIIGVLFSYLIVLPRALEFFYELDRGMGITPDFKIGDYVKFASRFTLMFGLAFELPVIVMTFVKLGLLGYQTMKSSRSYAILAIFVIAALITPTPDAFTLCLMAGPMIILYEICIWLSYFTGRKEEAARLQEEAEERMKMEKLLAKATPTVSVSRNDEDVVYFDDTQDLEPLLEETEEGEEEDISDPTDSDKS